MHLLLTDILTCPRCGPEHGLILLAERIEERRVLEGRLGCANCRETYPVRDGIADLRAGEPAAVLAGVAAAEEPAEAAARMAALLGLARAAGHVLLAGAGAELAAGVAALVPEVEVVALSGNPASLPPAAGVSRVAAGPGLPFRDRSLRGAALTGGAGETLLGEGVRVVAPGGRIVVEPAGHGTAERLAAAGARVLLEQDGVVVAQAPGVPVPLRPVGGGGSHDSVARHRDPG